MTAPVAARRRGAPSGVEHVAAAVRVGRPGERVEPPADERRVGRQRAVALVGRRAGRRSSGDGRRRRARRRSRRRSSKKISSPSPVSSPARRAKARSTPKARMTSERACSRSRSAAGPAVDPTAGRAGRGADGRATSRAQAMPVARLPAAPAGRADRGPRRAGRRSARRPSPGGRRAGAATPRTRAGCGARSGGRTRPRRSRRAPRAPARPAGRGWRARRRRRSGRWSARWHRPRRPASCSRVCTVSRATGSLRPAADEHVGDQRRAAGAARPVQIARQPGGVGGADRARPATAHRAGLAGDEPGQPLRQRLHRSQDGAPGRGHDLAQRSCIRGSGTGGIVTPSGSRPKTFSVRARKRFADTPTVPATADGQAEVRGRSGRRSSRSRGSPAVTWSPSRAP